MAVIHDLLSKIGDKSLRERIEKEVEKLTKQKKFGLVFEEHIPECTPLYDIPIAIGSKVAKKSGYVKDLYLVKSIDGDEVVCEHKDTHEEKSFHKDELVSVAEFGEAIYPYLKPVDSICNAPDSDLWHTLIEADNYHALQLLEYLYAGKVDCIYIDPPYNTGARDWKYNNDYVDSSDAYRHSKWLSMMEKRLRLAKKLLNPNDSVLIVTIDEKEYLHLGCLLEELFPEAQIQMITNIISGKGVSRDGQFSRVEEYIFMITLGLMKITQLEKNMLNDNDSKNNKEVISFLGFRRRNKGNYRTSRPNQFYPIIVDNIDGHIVQIGDAITHDIQKENVYIPDGCTGLWPLDPKGEEKIWSVVPETARILLKKGCIKVVNWKPEKRIGSVKYLPSGIVKKIDDCQIIVEERDKYGAIIKGHSSSEDLETLRPRRVWNVLSHNASTFGTLLLKKFLETKRFSFPKSLYAVHDTLRFFVSNKPNALIIDFFAGSGTTLHAVNLLNAEDGGKRRCIIVTNNEVSEEESKELAEKGFHPGDEEWEKLGIAQYVAWPRIVCSIKGIDILGNSVKDEYLTYLTQKKVIKRNIKQVPFESIAQGNLKAKKQLVGLLGMGQLPQTIVNEDSNYIVPEDSNVSILFNDKYFEEWLDEIDGRDNLTDIFIITNNDKLFNRIKKEIENLLGDYIIEVPKKIPMSEGFKANATYFKLGFLDKTAVELGRQFRELLPILWMKAGAIGPCPTLKKGKDVPPMLILPKNSFAILNDESQYLQFRMDMENHHNINTIFFVTDFEPAYQSMARDFEGVTTYHLYRDYLDNFKINKPKI